LKWNYKSKDYVSISSSGKPFHPGSTYDNSQASRIVPDAVKTLERLGYLYRSSNLCHIAARNGE